MNKLKWFRTKHTKLSGTDMAKKLGYSQRTYWNKENGRSGITLEDLENLAKHYPIIDFNEFIKGEIKDENY